jgi:antitoxin HicB
MKSIEDFLALNYAVTVHKDEDGDYVVRVDDLPGCVTHGSTPDEAFKNLEEAKRAWMESRIAMGLEIPEPRQVEEYSGRVLLRMPKWLHRRLAVQSRTEGVSLNQYVTSLLSDASARGEAGLRQHGYSPVFVCSSLGTQGRISQYYMDTYNVGPLLEQEWTALARRESATINVLVEHPISQEDLGEKRTKTSPYSYSA